MGEITWLDYLLLPFYLYIIYKIAYYFQKRFYPEGHPYRPYFIPALTVKIGGALFVGLLYQYYYGGGDTLNFFYHAQIINQNLLSAPDTWFRLITHQADTSNSLDAAMLNEMYWYDDIQAYVTSCLGAFIGLFCFTKYLIINVLTAVISFAGLWQIFKIFVDQYRNLIKPLAIAILFIPGVVVWGSGLFKDTFCMIAICGLVYTAYLIFEKRTFKLYAFLLLLSSIALLFLIKAYILAALAPILFTKVILVYIKRLISRPDKRVYLFLYIALLLLITPFAIKKITTSLSSAAAESVLETIKTQKDYLLEVSIETQGSAYDLGDFDPTFSSLMTKFGPAVNVTLFRPYIWECHNIVQLFDGLQSAVFLSLTIYLIFKRNPLKTLKIIVTDPNLIMCLGFTLFFAFMVGVSTYNFGSLSRYKIPCLPFYGLFLGILIFSDNDKTNQVSAEGLDTATLSPQDTYAG